MKRVLIPVLLVALAACSSDLSTGTTTTTTTTLSFKNNPCGAGGTVQLAEAAATRIDCSAGGTTVTLAGNGASYLIVPQFATDQVTNTLVSSYTMSSGTAVAASVIPNGSPALRAAIATAGAGSSGGLLPPDTKHVRTARRRACAPLPCGEARALEHLQSLVDAAAEHAAEVSGARAACRRQHSQRFTWRRASRRRSSRSSARRSRMSATTSSSTSTRSRRPTASRRRSSRTSATCSTRRSIRSTPRRSARRRTSTRTAASSC